MPYRLLVGNQIQKDNSRVAGDPSALLIIPASQGLRNNEGAMWEGVLRL